MIRFWNAGRSSIRRLGQQKNAYRGTMGSQFVITGDMFVKRCLWETLTMPWCRSARITFL